MCDFGSHCLSFLFCEIGKRQTAGTVSVLAASPWPLPSQSTVPMSRLPGAGILASHFCSSGSVCAWSMPYGKGRPGQACTLNCPVTMGSEEWGRKWKSVPSVLPITPSAGWTSWESILNAYSAAAAVRVAVMCLKSRSSCLYSGPHLLLRRKSS